MPARQLTDGRIEVRTSSGALVFERAFASLAWPEDSGGHLLVMGLKADGRMSVFSEGSGGLFELGTLARQAVADYLIDSIIIDARDKVSAMGLRNLDGLCSTAVVKSQGSGKSRIGRPSKASRLQAFGASLTVSPAPARLISNYRGALERTRVLVMSRRIAIDETGCPTLAHELTQPISYVMNSTAVKALVLASGCVPDDPAPPSLVDLVSTRWYANRPRT